VATTTRWIQGIRDRVWKEVMPVVSLIMGKATKALDDAFNAHRKVKKQIKAYKTSVENDIASLELSSENAPRFALLSDELDFIENKEAELQTFLRDLTKLNKIVEGIRQGEIPFRLWGKSDVVVEGRLESGIGSVVVDESDVSGLGIEPITTCIIVLGAIIAILGLTLGISAVLTKRSRTLAATEQAMVQELLKHAEEQESKGNVSEAKRARQMAATITQNAQKREPVSGLASSLAPILPIILVAGAFWVAPSIIERFPKRRE